MIDTLYGDFELEKSAKIVEPTQEAMNEYRGHYDYVVVALTQEHIDAISAGKLTAFRIDMDVVFLSLVRPDA